MLVEPGHLDALAQQAVKYFRPRINPRPEKPITKTKGN
jgi:hypothetical protein